MRYRRRRDRIRTSLKLPARCMALTAHAQTPNKSMNITETCILLLWMELNIFLGRALSTFDVWWWNAFHNYSVFRIAFASKVLIDKLTELVQAYTIHALGVCTHSITQLRSRNGTSIDASSTCLSSLWRNLQHVCLHTTLIWCDKRERDRTHASTQTHKDTRKTNQTQFESYWHNNMKNIYFIHLF